MSQSLIELLIGEKECGAFNLWEKNFINDVSDKKFHKLSRRDKAVVVRLINWLKGFEKDLRKRETRQVAIPFVRLGLNLNYFGQILTNHQHELEKRKGILVSFQVPIRTQMIPIGTKLVPIRIKSVPKQQKINRNLLISLIKIRLQILLDYIQILLERRENLIKIIWEHVKLYLLIEYRYSCDQKKTHTSVCAKV